MKRPAMTTQKGSETTSRFQRIGAAQASAAKPGAREYFIRDMELKGFFLRIQPSGVKSYGVEGRLARRGSKLLRTIGSTAAYTAKEARAIARDWLVKLDEGLDPKQASRGAMNACQLLEQYIESKSLKHRTVADYRYNFNHYLKPLNRKPIGQIMVDDLVRWYSAGKAHATGTERTFVVLKSVLELAYALGYIEENPAKKAALLVRRKRNPSKQQHLSEIYDALPRFMTAFAKADISTVMRDWMVLSLTTGLRRQESMNLSWEQVDLKQKRVVLPTNKSDRFLIVPMIGLTYDLFQSRLASAERDETYVFTSKPGIPIKDARKALARVCKDAGIAPYSHHDFRLLFASMCHELGISESEIGGLLNHSPKTVTPVYINQSLNHARSIYQRVVDALDRSIKLDEPEAGQDTQVTSATDFMRCVFYGKVPLSPDLILAGEADRSSASLEQEYWEGGRPNQ